MTCLCFIAGKNHLNGTIVPRGTSGPVPVGPLAVQPRLGDAVGPHHRRAPRAAGRGWGAALPVRGRAPPGQPGGHGGQGHRAVGLVRVALHDGEALLRGRPSEEQLRGVYHERTVATCGQIRG